MKKVKQSKKRWAWTEAQKRRHFSKPRWGSVPSAFCRYYHRENKTYVKLYLHKVIRGYDIDYLYIRLKNQESSAGYDWW